MTNLRARIEQMGGPAEPTTPFQIEEDLGRGRRAARRRRTTQAVAGSVFAAAALVATLSFVTADVGQGPVPPAAAPRSAAAVPVTLVDYQGAQPRYFTIDTVPAGYFVQAEDQYSLMLAPNRAKNPVGEVNPSTAPVYDPNSFVDKIVMLLQTKTQGVPDGSPVTVGDSRGILVETEPGGGWQLWVKQPSGVHLIVQFDEGVGLSRTQMIEIGAGAHAHRDAQQAVG